MATAEPDTRDGPAPLWPVLLILAACVVGLAVAAYLDANRRPGDVPPPIPLSVE